MASELIPNITRDQIVTKGLDIVIVSSSNNSNFNQGSPLYLRASNGAKPQEKVFNEIAESLKDEDFRKDENGDTYAVIEKVTKFQVSTYNRNQKQYDIYINDVYLTAAEQKAFLLEQGFTEDEFLNRYGKKGMFNGYLIKFSL